MSLAKLYSDRFSSQKTASVEKTAAEIDAEMVESIVDQLSDEDCEKLAAACDVLDENNAEFDTGVEKIAAAAELCDLAEEGEATDDEAEKVAAEYEAAGRIFAQGFMDELNK